MEYILFIWTVILCVWTAKVKICDKLPVGWANLYRRFDDQIIIGAVKEKRKDCISVGKCERAKSEYLGTFKIYKQT
ncbi:hypothetical protein [Alishewanella phage vB_AspM_Slickus01]|nr:hypothetical protein [Alishewanella phage vB_AspM_Slickus01]